MSFNPYKPIRWENGKFIWPSENFEQERNPTIIEYIWQMTDLLCDSYKLAYDSSSKSVDFYAFRNGKSLQNEKYPGVHCRSLNHLQPELEKLERLVRIRSILDKPDFF